MLRQMENAQEEQSEGQIVHWGNIGGRPVILTCLHDAGNVHAASATRQLLSRFDPGVVLLIGIAGGAERPASDRLTSETHQLGDILVPDQIVAYESGEQEADGLERRPQVYRTSRKLLAAAREISQADWIHDISVPRPDGTTGRVGPQTHFGSVASGEKVITDSDFVGSLKEGWPELIGVEMEGLGVALAVEDAGSSADFLLVKGICDWADPDKNDDWQEYAADASAAFASALIRRSADSTKTENVVLSSADTFSLSGEAKVTFCRRLGKSWEDLADLAEIRSHEKATFERGNEPRRVWEWLEQRERLHELPELLHRIGRADLAREITANP